ncbi:hypothetical protein CL689_07195 [Candidatus Saccharibacteria bacterium]|nr:hypothetical protein [Candidatus Saccharibacteria bacterium]MBQ69806.1 hypothetical protein [Candidatus Saccharibacteria bacterium]
MKKKILIGIISAGILIISAFGAYFLFGHFGQRADREELDTTPLMATSVIEMLESSELAGLEGYDRQEASGDSFGIVAATQGRDYRVSVAADDAALYQKSGDPRQSIELAEYASVRQQTEGYFIGQGLDKLSSSSDATDQYAGRGVICQANFVTSGVATVVYACSDEAALSAEYDQIEQLLNTYKETGAQVVDFDVASRTSLQRDDIEGVVLHLSPDRADEQNKGAQYLFGAINGDWEFVADLTNGTSLGKVNTTPEAEVKIADPKWDNVLYELLYGGGKE